MATANAQRLDLARSVWRALATESELTRDQARAFVRGLQTSWQVPTIRWGNEESSSQLEDAFRLLHSARIFRGIDGGQSQEAMECYRRAAEILEWLARADDPLRTIVPIDLFAAAAFQLGGLPAMSRGLLLQLVPEEIGSKLYGAFLQADFDAVIKNVTKFWKEHPELTRREGSQSILNDERSDRLEWYFTVELVRALGLFAHAIRRHDSSRIERAMAKLSTLNEMALRTFSEDVWILVSLLQEVAEGFKEASIFIPLQRLGEANPEKNPRLRLYGRGQFSRGRGILWRPQIQGLERLMDSSSFALCTPTGSGKTLVATMALLKELVVTGLASGVAPLAIYLVPSRALAGEVEAKLRSELGRDLTITGLYGGTDWGITDYWLQSDDPTVLVATVEKADALMRFVGPLIVSRLKLLIIDEAHQVVIEDTKKTRGALAEHSNRSIRIESFVSRILARVPQVARIALTAVAGGASDPVAKWMQGTDDASAIGTRYRSTRQVLGSIEFGQHSAGRVVVEMVNGQTLFIRGREDAVYIPLRTPVMPQLPAAMRNSIYRFNALSVLWTVLHLIGEDRKVLISVAQEPEEMMRWFREAFKLPAWSEVNQFQYPKDGAGAERFEAALKACKDYCGDDSHEAALLAQGIATSHGQMPQHLRRLMTELIEDRICPITLATATLTEGVNLPFDLIFLTSLKRQTFDAQAQQQVVTPISIPEFQNLAGRAGRPGATRGMEGLTLVAIPTEPSTTAAATRATQTQQIEGLKRDYADLLENLRRSGSGSSDVQSPLALLLRAIAELSARLKGVRSEEGFLEWLEKVSLGEGNGTAAAGQMESEDEITLTDSVDELDAFILGSVEEVRSLDEQDLTPAEIEARLKSIWQESFARVATNREEWMERALLRRATAVTERVYPDPNERRRLYQYGFAPSVGRRFAKLEPEIATLLAQSEGYGEEGEQARLSRFLAIGKLVADDRGFGFRARGSAKDQRLLANWQDALRWWLNVEGAEHPEPNELRRWQRFVFDNMEFRLGTVIGAVVAQAWSTGAGSVLEVPSLKAWKATTGLPWFAFWARELLRWGTLEPFTAFAMAQGLAGTRREAASLHDKFRTWISENEEGVDAEDLIDPQKYLAWQRERADAGNPQPEGFEFRAEVAPHSRLRQSVYSVLPIAKRDHLSWVDAAGFELATTPKEGSSSKFSTANDYELRIDQRRGWTVRRTYRAV